MDKKIPVNIFTGFLGAGKTTIIKGLLEQVERPEKIVWLKNEYGNENIDALMVKETNVQPVEVLNGCLCCVLVGRLHDALEEIIEKNSPERIIIETSGTAWPGPIVREVKRIDSLHVDSVVNIIDVENFVGYDDISYAAKMQTQFVDLVIFNKYPKSIDTGSKEELDLEHKLDDVYEVFLHTPKVKTTDGRIDLKILIGLDSNSMKQLDTTEEKKHVHQDEVETVILKFNQEQKFSKQGIDEKLSALDKKKFIRIKGVVNLDDDSTQLINWVFGKGNWTKLPKETYQGESKIVFMGKGIDKASLSLFANQKYND